MESLHVHGRKLRRARSGSKESSFKSRGVASISRCPLLSPEPQKRQDTQEKSTAGVGPDFPFTTRAERANPKVSHSPSFWLLLTVFRYPFIDQHLRRNLLEVGLDRSMESSHRRQRRISTMPNFNYRTRLTQHLRRAVNPGRRQQILN
jgi:hypothetical protein